MVDRTVRSAIAFFLCGLVWAGFQPLQLDTRSAWAELTGPPDTTLVVRTRPERELGYASDRFEIPADTPITVWIDNRSYHPHNWVVVRDSAAARSVGRAAQEFGPQGFIPESHLELIVGYVPLVAPMTRGGRRFTSPPPGRYPVVCTFGDHRTAIRGVLVSLEH